MHVFTVVKSPKVQFSQLSLDGPQYMLKYTRMPDSTRDPQETSFILNYHGVLFQVFKTRY